MGKISRFFTDIPMAGDQRKKMVSLDREFDEMEAEINSLKTENLRLQAQVNPLQRQVDQLRDQIHSAKEKAAEQTLDEKAVALLSAISQKFHIGRGGGEAIIKGTSAQAAYYLGLLKERRLIRYMAGNYTLDGRYVTTQEGLEYLRKVGKL